MSIHRSKALTCRRTSNNVSATGAIYGKINEYDGKSSKFATNFFLSSPFNAGVENASALGCTKLSSVAMKACVDMIGSPYIPNNNSRPNDGYPVFEWQSNPYEFLDSGTASEPYQISNKEELEQMRSLVNSDFFNATYGHACYIQTANIDLENVNWTPIDIGYEKMVTLMQIRCFMATTMEMENILEICLLMKVQLKQDYLAL